MKSSNSKHVAKAAQSAKPSDSDLALIIPQLRPLAIPIGSVSPDPFNPQIHNVRNLAAIQTSISTKLQDQPIVVRREDMVIIKGHGRWSAMKNLGATHIAAIVVDESRLSAIERGLADNRASALATVDEDLLASVITDLHIEGGIAIGWTDAELAALLHDLDEGAEAAASAAEAETALQLPGDGAIEARRGISLAEEHALHNDDPNPIRRFDFHYRNDEYKIVYEKLDKARVLFGVETNAALLLKLLELAGV